MRALAALAVLASCWRADPPPAPPRPTRPAAPPACDEATFDAANPACRDVCSDAAPDDWRGCEPMPRDEVPPPPVASNGQVLGRVIAIEIVLRRTRLTVMGGTNDGVTAAWQGELADSAGHVVPRSSCAIIFAAETASLCETEAPRTQVLANGYVLLHP